MTTFPAHYHPVGVLFLVGIGFYALLVLRNMIKVIVALQLLVKGSDAGDWHWRVK